MIWLLLVALACSAVATPAAIGLLRSARLMDVPSARSSHSHATVRGAGWGVVVGVLAAWTAFNWAAEAKWWLTALALTFGLIGFADDLRPLPPQLRLAFQLLTSAAVLILGVSSNVLDLSPLWLITSVLFLVSYVNAFNFMDGIDAISGLQTLVVGCLVAGAGAIMKTDLLVAGGLAAAGGALGFLPFNAVRARGFLGDVGSYFLGAWLGGLCLLAFDRKAGAVFIVSVVAIYASDTAFTLVSRVQRGATWWSPHREHVYQRLTDHGWSHLASACFVAFFSALCGSLGLLTVRTSGGVDLAVLLAICVICAVYLATPFMLKVRQGQMGQVQE